MQDYRIASQESLMATLIAHVFTLQGQLSAALGQIQALQTRDQTHAASKANNMQPKRTSAAARAAATTVAVAASMTAVAVDTNGHGDGSHNSGTRTRGSIRTPRECTYKDFLNCQPLTFNGTEGVIVLAHWFERMESVFHISNCAVENQVKFATCTFPRNVLTWWNSYMKVDT
ncbi:hypothetical protein Tco_0720772 [Tanacetum coccineum]